MVTRDTLTSHLGHAVHTPHGTRAWRIPRPKQTCDIPLLALSSPLSVPDPPPHSHTQEYTPSWYTHHPNSLLGIGNPAHNPASNPAHYDGVDHNPEEVCWASHNPAGGRSAFRNPARARPAFRNPAGGRSGAHNPAGEWARDEGPWLEEKGG